MPIEWDDLPFAGVAVCFSDLHGLLMWGCCWYRPGLEAADGARLRPVMSTLGMPATSDAAA